MRFWHVIFIFTVLVLSFGNYMRLWHMMLLTRAVITDWWGTGHRDTRASPAHGPALWTSVDLVSGSIHNSTMESWQQSVVVVQCWRSLSGMQVELILNSLENSLSNSLQDKKYFKDNLWATLKIAFSLQNTCRVVKWSKISVLIPDSDV